MVLFIALGIVCMGLTQLVNPQCSSSANQLLLQIEHDLRPFKRQGISKQMVDAAYCIKTPGFRAQVINGSLFIVGETYSYETRALSVKMMLYSVVTRFGHLLPDLDFIVSLGDFPPPQTRMKKLVPMLSACRTKRHKTILYPDHTFWNWMEASTPGWETSLLQIPSGRRLVSKLHH
jgi:hypothetical protein